MLRRGVRPSCFCPIGIRGEEGRALHQLVPFSSIGGLSSSGVEFHSQLKIEMRINHDTYFLHHLQTKTPSKRKKKKKIPCLFEEKKKKHFFFSIRCCAYGHTLSHSTDSTPCRTLKNLFKSIFFLARDQRVKEKCRVCVCIYVGGFIFPIRLENPSNSQRRDEDSWAIIIINILVSFLLL